LSSAAKGAQRDEASTQLSKIDAKIADYSEQEREYFKRANDIARWTDKAAGAFSQYNLVGAWKLDAYGNKLDVSPEDAQHRPVVPDEHWPAVQQLRDLYAQRATIGQSLSAIDSGLRDMAVKNPALAYLSLASSRQSSVERGSRLHQTRPQRCEDISESDSRQPDIDSIGFG
jgi:hypothetical protein